MPPSDLQYVSIDSCFFFQSKPTYSPPLTSYASSAMNHNIELFFSRSVLSAGFKVTTAKIRMAVSVLLCWLATVSSDRLHVHT